MYQNLITDAKEKGLTELSVNALVRHEDHILLIEETRGIYTLPSTLVREDETLQQALQRGLVETTNLMLEEVIAYLGHNDIGKKERHFYFATTVHDPFAVQLRNHVAFAWVDIQEAVGYPISDELRQTLDFFAKLVT